MWPRNELKRICSCLLINNLSYCQIVSIDLLMSVLPCFHRQCLHAHLSVLFLDVICSPMMEDEGLTSPSIFIFFCSLLIPQYFILNKLNLFSTVDQCYFITFNSFPPSFLSFSIPPHFYLYFWPRCRPGAPRCSPGAPRCSPGAPQACVPPTSASQMLALQAFATMSALSHLISHIMFVFP